MIYRSKLLNLIFFLIIVTLNFSLAQRRIKNCSISTKGKEKESLEFSASNQPPTFHDRNIRRNSSLSRVSKNVQHILYICALVLLVVLRAIYRVCRGNRRDRQVIIIGSFDGYDNME